MMVGPPEVLLLAEVLAQAPALEDLAEAVEGNNM
jgi:hypothetical protein